MIKLKPCPICGLEPEMEPWHGSGLNSTRIGCNADFCPVGVGVVRPSQRGAIKAWNTRPIEDALRAEVAELTVERDRFREMFKAAKLSVCDLEAKLDKRDEPLTDEQAERAFAIAKENGVGECDTLAHGVQGIDAAIRRVRRGE